ncbi:MAG: LolA family protein [Terracidiphilus sp.]
MREDREQRSGNRDQAVRPAAAIFDRAFEQNGGISSYLLLCTLLLLSLSTGTGISLDAQQPPPLRDAHAVAQLVDSHYNRLHSLRDNFTESYEGLGMSRAESGTLLLLKPGRMRWDYTTPAGKLFLIDGKFAWFYGRGATQVQRIPATKLDDLRSPLRFLLGHTQLEKELTGLQLASTPTAPGEYTLVGQLKGQENRVRSISLTVAPSTGAIVAIDIEETDGATTRFTFSGEETNVAIPDSAFKFTPPAGVPVVDAIPPV